ncbi:uncharacterized protein LOC134813296 [Bolinopsis microptera]|uniref:uncharacterized protein LOC134813296 n=1 Tax=Bolinopsis microptera TaxID=2820187 RepID=UPI003079C826
MIRGVSLLLSAICSLTLVLNHGVRTEDTAEEAIVQEHQDWKFYKASLIREVNGTVIRTRNEGFLVVNFTNKKSGETTNGTVCPGNFNWYHANTFCRYFGNEQGMWDNKPNSLKLISEALLKHDRSIFLSNVSCKNVENGDERNECDVRISAADGCNNNYIVWLNCNNGTDMWNSVVSGKMIPIDVGPLYFNLHIRTTSAAGSNDETIIYYYDEKEAYAGGIYIVFNSTIKHAVFGCNNFLYPIPFPTSLPAEQSKHWVIMRGGHGMVIYCNGEEVLDLKVMSSQTCDPSIFDMRGYVWGKEVSSISFSPDHNSASDSYNIEHSWKFHRANLINLVEGTERLNDNGGLLIATVINKQTGEERNGTVCKNAFTWYSAQLFCLSIGHRFADWGSYPRNMKYISENRLDETDVSITMDNVRCNDNDTDISVCISRIMRHSCQYRDSIWLRCFNNTGCDNDNQRSQSVL